MFSIRLSVHAFFIQIYWYTCIYWIFRFSTDFWFSFKPAGQCMYWMPKSHHLIIHTCVCLCMSFSFILRTRWVAFWLSWTFMSGFRILDHLGSLLLIKVAQLKRGSSVDHPEPFSSRPPARLSSFPIVTRESLFILLILVYFIFHASWWCNIYVILCHILW